MKFSKNSWHYKFLTESQLKDSSFSWDLENGYKTSICPYVRKLFATFLIHFVIYFILGAALFSMIHAPIFIVVDYFYTGLNMFFDPPLELFVLLGLVFWMFLIVVGVISVYKRYEDKLKEFFSRGKESKPKPPKKPSLIGMYIKAIHDKMCPIIEFDEEK